MDAKSHLESTVGNIRVGWRGLRKTPKTTPTDERTTERMERTNERMNKRMNYLQALSARGAVKMTNNGSYNKSLNTTNMAR